MRKVSVLVVILSVMAASPVTPAYGATPDCVANFSNTGSFFKGRQFKSTATVAIDTTLAFKRAYASLAKKGYQIISSDKDIGLISASQVVAMSDGKTVPFNVVVEPKGKGSELSFHVNLPGGLSTSEDAIRDEFCVITNEVARK